MDTQAQNKQFQHDYSNYKKQVIDNNKWTIEGSWTERWMKMSNIQQKQFTSDPNITFKNITQKHYEAQYLLDLYNNIGRNFSWGFLQFFENEQQFYDYFLGNPNTCITLEVFLKQDNGQEVPIGFVQYFKEENENAYIGLFGLKQEFQGKGLGQKIMQSTLHKIQQEAYSSVTLYTDSHDSPWAFNFYQKQGYELTETKQSKVYKRYYFNKL